MKRFTVRGKPPFPYDMLRYDSCWPATQDDAFYLSAMDRVDPKPPRTVTLETASKNAPTVERWASFRWEVVGD